MNQIAALLHQVDAVARGMAHAEPVRRPIERQGFECVGNYCTEAADYSNEQ